MSFLKTKLVVGKLIMFEVAMDTLRTIGSRKRKTRDCRLARSAVDFIDTQLTQHGRKMRLK